MRILTLITVFFLLLTFSSPVSAQSEHWMELQPKGDEETTWKSGKISTDGETIFVAETEGRLWISTNGGENWSETRPDGDNDYSWMQIAMSADGAVLMALSDYNNDYKLYRSTNGGTSWSEVAYPSTPTNVADFGMSRDGQVVVSDFQGSEDGWCCWVYPHHILLSTNGGGSWSDVLATPYLISNEYQNFHISSDNQTIYAWEYWSIHRTTDGGENWSSTESFPYVTDEFAMSGDAQKLLATQGNTEVYPRTAYVSFDGGENWTESNPLGAGEHGIWYGPSISDDGQTMFIIESGNAHLSFDGGTSWLDQEVAVGDSGFSSMTPDGEYILAGGESSLYLYSESIPTPEIGGPSAKTRSSRPRPPTCHDAKPTSAPDLFQIDVNNTQASLYFTPTLNADRFYISYGDGETVDQYGVEVVTGSRTGVIGYTINHLQPGQTYTFTVRSGNGCMPGNWSNTMTITTRRSSNGGTSYYKDFVARVLSYFPSPVDYIQPTDQVLGATTTQTVSLRCVSEPVQVDPPLYSYIPDPYGVKSMLQLIKLLGPKCSLVFPY